MAKIIRAPAHWGPVFDGTLPVPEDPAIVEAFNARDMAALDAALAASPDSRLCLMYWNTPVKRDKYTLYSLRQAAMKMNWPAALGALWRAGERFERNGYEPALLELATHTGKGATVRKLLALGVDPNGTAQDRPLAHMALHHAGKREQRKRYETTWQAYAKAGVDPWAERDIQEGKDTWTVMEALLNTGQVQAVEFFMTHAERAGQPVPESVLANGSRGFWQAFEGSLNLHAYGSWLEHGGLKMHTGNIASWMDNREGLANIARLAARAGIAVPTELVNQTADYLMNVADKAPQAKAEVLVPACEVGQMLIEAYPQETELTKLMARAVLANASKLPVGRAAYWEHVLLDETTPALPSVRRGRRL